MVKMHVKMIFFRIPDLKDMSKMILRTSGPSVLPEGYKLSLHISQTDAERVRVFRARSTKQAEASLSELQKKIMFYSIMSIDILF